MQLQNDSGYILVTVLIVVLLLSILGGSYAYVMINETNQSARHNDSVQAYYYARSGAEAGLERVHKGLDLWYTGNVGYDDYFSNFKGDLENGFNDINDKINVTIQIESKKENPFDDITSLEEISIISRGTYFDAEKTIELFLFPPVHLSAPDQSDVEDSEEKYPPANNAINGINGNNISGNIDGADVLAFKSLSGNNNWSNTTNTEATIDVNEIFFTEHLHIKHSTNNNTTKLVLKASFIGFYEEVTFQSNPGIPEVGSLCLEVPDDKDYGIIYFDKNQEFDNGSGDTQTYKGFYKFEQSICLPYDHNLLLEIEENGFGNINHWTKVWH